MAAGVPRNEEETNHPFFDQLPQTDINSVLRFADRQCRFMDAFTHRLGRFARPSPNKPALIASLVGWGTNTGMTRMGQISDLRKTFCRWFPNMKAEGQAVLQAAV
jgi:hypothetical protein